MKIDRSIFLHILVWVAYVNILVLTIYSFEELTVAVERASLIAAVHAFIFYLNADYLMPKFLEQKRVVLYVMQLVFVLALLMYGVQRTSVMGDFGPHPSFDKFSEKRFDTPMGREMDRKPPPLQRFDRKNKPVLHPRVIGLTISSFLALFISAIYFNVRSKKKKDEEMLKLRNESLEAESKLLKSQINPHFLFNTLNNLYYLASVKSDLAPQAIQQLSEILRYTIYDSDHAMVPLDKEVAYIEHYIRLQCLKEEGHINQVSFKAEGVDGQLMIAPMLLLPFVENSFKHGNLAESKEAFIEVNLATRGSKITFHCKNSLSDREGAKDKTPGIGMKNVERRLQLVYGVHYDLYVNDSKGIFEIKLELNV
ncbi:hypothetical protein BFP72_18560 [Reichenbachiella sp. 5M10]|uniref:sensor histidine kinase n=1 Tax=Reichenbachiella sp. 5M10 TaxID=1889772 RepID=UPI000C15451F|nr:sensor histidine kinase [Reichenbachiella sp. 5M10]PIB37268.1 hypothetical protein BFP72_18560 [Reichenbachiella sp. 5M10]